MSKIEDRVEGVILSEYVICMVRGHEASGGQLPVNPPYDVCQYCSMPFRHESRIVELYEDAVKSALNERAGNELPNAELSDMPNFLKP